MLGATEREREKEMVKSQLEVLAALGENMGLVLSIYTVAHHHSVPGDLLTSVGIGQTYGAHTFMQTKRTHK